MFNKKSLILIFTALIFISLCQNTTNPSRRTQTVQNQCPSQRKYFFQNINGNKYKKYGDMTYNQLKTDGQIAVKNILNSQWNQAFNSVKNNGKVWTYFIIFAIFAVIMLISFPFLLCCICCPTCCPPTICRSPLNKTPSQNSIICPTVFIIILGLLVIGTMATNIAFGQKLYKSIDQIQCSFGIIFDDTLNGNVSLDGSKKFIGINNIYSRLLQLNTNLDQIVNQIQPISSSGSVIPEIKSNIQQAKNQLNNVPNLNGGNLELSYRSPLNDLNPTQTINSQFINVLGNTNNPISIIGFANIGLIGVDNSVSVVQIAADQVKNNVPGFKSTLQTNLIPLQNTANEIKNTDNDIYQSVQDVQSKAGKPIQIVYFIITSITIFLSLVIIIISVLICKDFYGCRRLFYFFCIIFAIFGIFIFVLSILFSFTTMAGYFGCQYLKDGLKSPLQFKDKFGQVINDDKLTDQLSTCLPTQQGNIVQKIVGQQVFGMIYNIKNLSQSLKQFNQEQILNLYSITYQNMQKNITDYKTAKISDIRLSQQNTQILQKLSQPQNYQCNSNGFSSDSWVPSNNQINTYITCKANSLCTLNPALGCGCIDTYLVLQNQTSSSDVQNYLKTRYPDTSCDQFNNQLRNTWNNFYKVKNEVLTPVILRAQTAEDKLNVVKSNIQNNIYPVIQNLQNNLQNTYSSIFSQNDGLINGVDCRVIGQDLQKTVDKVCSQAFIYSFIMRVMFIIAAFSIMIMVYLMAFLGIKNYRKYQSQRTPILYIQNGGTQNVIVQHKVVNSSKDAIELF